MCCYSPELWADEVGVWALPALEHREYMLLRSFSGGLLGSIFMSISCLMSESKAQTKSNKHNSTRKKDTV